MRLEYRPPYDWDGVLSFLRARATPGVEYVDHHSYQRTTAAGILRVTNAADASAICIDDCGDPERLTIRVKQLFDLEADPQAIERQLGRDCLLAEPLQRHRGIRVPGAWDPFELCVRAIVGQQITVRAATTITGRLAERWGTPVRPGTLSRLFPNAEQLADAPIEEAGIIRARAGTIRAVARAVCTGQLRFDDVDTMPSLRAIPGIGEWTAQYIAMRTIKDADAFPSGDVVLRRMAGGLTARALDQRAEPWRPYRAYAAMLLWRAASQAQP